MIIELKFDYCTSFVYLPDNTIRSGSQLQRSFLSWIEDQPENIVISKTGKAAIAYSDADIIKYLNTVFLSDSREKAYLIPLEKIRKPAGMKLVF